MSQSVCSQESLDLLVDSAREVFGIMLGMDIQMGEPFTGVPSSISSQVKGTIGLTGSVTGLITLNMSKSAAADAVEILLGLDAACVSSSEIIDAVGELSNMIAGGWKTRISDSHDAQVAISLPIVSVGEDYVVEAVGQNAAVIIPIVGPDDSTFLELIVGGSGNPVVTTSESEEATVGKDLP
jgi:chemotaxis protein CheX